jgi:hypothetical protein
VASSDLQGMSDLLSPILYIMDNEVDAFWCFAALMERMASNFHRDQNGMHSQLLSLRKVSAAFVAFQSCQQIGEAHLSLCSQTLRDEFCECPEQQSAGNEADFLQGVLFLSKVSMFMRRS